MDLSSRVRWLIWKLWNDSPKLARSVIFGMFLSLSKPQFLHLYIGDNNSLCVGLIFRADIFESLLVLRSFCLCHSSY